jgi:hypothetical protein
MEKLALFIFTIHKIIVWKFVYVKNLFIAWRTSWEVWSPAGTALCDRVDCPFPPLHFLPVWYVERAMYTEFWGTIPQYTVTRSCNTGSHCIIIIINNIISLLHLMLRNIKLILFRLSLCLFSIRSLGFLELFSNSPSEHLWPPLTRSSLPPHHREKYLIWVDSSLMAPLQMA